MKKFSILLMVVLFAMACEKEQQASVNEMMLKKKPATGNNGNTGGNTGNSFWIVPDQESITIGVGETYQLSVAPVNYAYPEVEYYENDHNIADVNWVGVVTGVAPGVTVISAYHYRDHGQPLQDNIIVYVQ